MHLKSWMLLASYLFSNEGYKGGVKTPRNLPIQGEFWRRSFKSWWTIFQHSWKKVIVKPSGTGALSDAKEKTATLVSSRSESLFNHSAFSSGGDLSDQLENQAPTCWFFKYTSLKNLKISSSIRWGTLHTDSWIVRAEIWLIFLRASTKEWKILMLLSPSRSHLALDCCLHLTSYRAETSWNFTFSWFLSIFRSSDRPFKASLSSKDWILSRNSSFLWQTLLKDTLFHSFKGILRFFSFCDRRPTHLPLDSGAHHDLTRAL